MTAFSSKHLMALRKTQNTLSMGKQAKYKQLSRELRAELDGLFIKNPNLTNEQKEQVFQLARKKAIIELSLKKKPK